jgi:methyl coenzyme M reductase subunit C-like uncharacterized protein (methanogenesis marker protein 7)
MYTKGHLATQVMCNPNGKGYVILSHNTEKDCSMIVSNPIESLEVAHNRARRYVGISESFDYDSYDQWLSEKLGF